MTRDDNSEFRQHQRELEILLDITRDLSSVLDLQKLLSLISERAATLLDADDCVFFRLEEDGVILRPVLARGDTAEKSFDCPLKVGQGFTGHSVAINKPLLINDTLHDPRGFHVPGTPVEENEHLLVTPLNFRGRTIGAMLINRLNKSPFTEAEFRLFIGFASQVAIALENARLYQKLESYTETLEETVEARTAQVRQQATWLEAILKTAQDAIVVTDCEGFVRHINPAALRVAHVSEIDALGKPLADLVSDLTSGTLPWTENPDTASQGEIQLGEKYYNYSVSPLHLSDQHDQGFVFVLTDITPLHRLDALKTEMIRIAAHDLRSPITSLGIQCDRLRRNPQPLTERQGAIVKRMETTTLEMLKMINELLNIERIEQQVSGMSEAVDVSSLLASALSLLEVQLTEKQQHVSIQIPDDLPTVCGDPVRLLEVLRNLLSNAHKYTPRGGQICLTAYTCENELCVEVSDSGIGTDADDLPRIFEAQFRAKTALDSREEGQGIGLSLVKTIIDEHGGQIWVTNQPGSGSTFGFSIPLTQSCLVQTSEIEMRT